MFKKATVLVVVSAAIASVALTQSAGASESPEWSLEDCVDAAGRPVTKLTSGAVCELKNRKNNQCLIRVSHMGQVDWDFASCDSHPKSARLVKEGGGDLKWVQIPVYIMITGTYASMVTHGQAADFSWLLAS